MNTITFKSPETGLLFPLRVDSDVIAYKSIRQDDPKRVAFQLRTILTTDLKQSPADLRKSLDAEGWVLSRPCVLDENLEELVNSKHQGEISPIIIENGESGWVYSSSMGAAAIAEAVLAGTKTGSTGFVDALSYSAINNKKFTK